MQKKKKIENKTHTQSRMQSIVIKYLLKIEGSIG